MDDAVTYDPDCGSLSYSIESTSSSPDGSFLATTATSPNKVLVESGSGSLPVYAELTQFVIKASQNAWTGAYTLN